MEPARRLGMVGKTMEERMTKNIATALATAQANMGKALKQTNNPHFRTKYADLGSVMDACLPSLNAAGIAVIQPTGEDEAGRFVETMLIHGESGESLSCRVPLIVGKNDMQGYGSAVTYARRYGLMTMAGIAPEDDDGNAAAANPPKQAEQPAPRKAAPQAQAKTSAPEDLFARAEKAMNEAQTVERVVEVWNALQGTNAWADASAERMGKASETYDANIARLEDKKPIIDDEIPETFNG